VLEAIVSAALHAVVASLVVGVVLGAIVFVLVRFLALSAAARHALWTIALVATALVPLAAFAVSASRASVGTTIERPAASTIAATLPAARSDVSGGRASRPETHVDGSSRTQRHEPSTPPAGTLPDLRLNHTIALAIVAAWALGAAIGFGGLVASLLRVRGLKRRSSPLDGALADDLPWLTESGNAEREIYLRLSYEIETPVAIGFRRPVILIPTELTTASGLGAIETLVMHENAHLQRYDDWTNLLQRAIERLFWFNPLVWIVGRRIALEREIASDEAVVARTGQPKEYATSLWRLAREMRMPEHAVVAPGALLTRKQISIRIETLLSGRTPIPALGPLAALAIVGAAVLSIVAAASSAPALQLPATPAVVAQASAAPESPAPLVQPPQPSASDVARMIMKASPRPDTRTKIHSLKPFFQVIPAAPASLTAPPVIYGTEPATRPTAPGVAAAPAPQASAHVRVVVNVSGDDSVTVDTDSIKRHISDLVDSTLASIPPATPRTVAQANEERELADKTDFPMIVQTLRNCTDCNLSGRNLRGIDLRGIQVVGANFADADLRDARLDGVTFTGVNLSGAKLDGASLVNARFVGVNINDVSLRGARLTGFHAIGSSFAGMDLRGLDVRTMLESCVGCNLSDANLAGDDLHGIRLTFANLSGTNLHNVNFSGAQLGGTNFAGANASGATFANASLTGCNFSGANIQGTLFTGAHLDGVNLGAD